MGADNGRKGQLKDQTRYHLETRKGKTKLKDQSYRPLKRRKLVEVSTPVIALVNILT